MHILHVIDALAVGGAERMLVDIANASADGGQRVSVCVTRSGVELATQLHPQIKLLILGRAKRFDFDAMRRLSAYVRDNDVDLLHVHGRSSFAFTALCKTLRFCSVPILLHDHFGGIETDSSVPAWFTLWGRFLVDAYVGVYSRLGEWGKSAGVPAERVDVVGNAVDFARLKQDADVSLHQELQIPKTTHVGVLVAGIRWEKGIDLLLDSLELVKTTQPYMIAVVGGDTSRSYAEECRQRVRDRGYADRVGFLGQRSDAAALIRGADFAVLASRSESGPLVLIEYMAAGLPFAAFRVGDISFRAEQLGLPGFVAPQDCVALAHEIELLLSLPSEKLRERGELGLSVAQQEFSIEAKLPDWFRIYDKLLRPGGR